MKLENISKSYDKHQIFENFTLEIEEGKILCLLGESGGGKTTLLNILAGLTDFSGRLSGIPDRAAYIFQEPRLLPNLTVRQNLEYATGGGKIEEILDRTELKACADKRPNSLSGGEKQRVAVARAFLTPARLLLMDEPFSSLDTALKIRLTGVFARLWTASAAEKRTAIFVTHDLEEALMLADRVVVLKKGKIAADVPIARREFPSPYAAPREEREKLLSVLLN